MRTDKHPGWILAAMAGLISAAALAATAGGVERRVMGNLVTENIPEVPAAVSERLARYLDPRSAGLVDWLPSGELIIATRFGDTAQLHRVSEPLGARRQLTFFDEPVTRAAASPDPKRPELVFLKDAGGNEDSQIFHLDLATGDYRMITDGASRNTNVRWSTRGDLVAFTSNRADGVHRNIWVTDPRSDEGPRQVVDAEGSWATFGWSGDDRTLLVRRYVSINESYLYLVDVATGERRPVDAGDEPAGISVAALHPDGRSVFVASDRGARFRQLYRVDVATGERTPVSAHIPWDVSHAAISRNGRHLAYVTNEGGVSAIHVVDAASLREVPGPRLPPGRIGSLRFSPDGRRLAVSLDTARSPRDVRVFSLDDARLTRWTESEVGGLATEKFVLPTVVSYPTFDEVDGGRREIPAFLYEPPGEGPHPVIVYIHGGPESQFRPGFTTIFQYFVHELGFAVVAPNVRGSSGYGKAYLKLDNGFRREDSVKDIGALLDWIDARDDLDGNRVVVYGGSYGGYMVLASMTHYDDRLLGGVDVVGISNFVTFLENTRDYRRDQRRVEYGDERDPAMRAHLEAISPTNNAHKITRPLLVVQGMNDPRVPASESEQMVATIREGGGTVWYLMAKDEGHGFRKKPNRDYYYATVSMFLESLLAE